MLEHTMTRLFFYILQIALQIFCIILIYKAIKNPEANGKKSFWKWFMAGFTFQLFRRILAVIWLFKLPFPDIRTMTLIIVPTCVSICYAMAMWNVTKFIIQEKKIKLEMDESFKKLKKISARL